jgi:toxin ParE1/3/4
MANIVLRQKAIDDLNSIWEYTFAEWSETQADKYYDMLRFSCLEIEKILKLENLITA